MSLRHQPFRCPDMNAGRAQVQGDSYSPPAPTVPFSLFGPVGKWPLESILVQTVA